MQLYATLRLTETHLMKEIDLKIKSPPHCTAITTFKAEIFGGNMDSQAAQCSTRNYTGFTATIVQYQCEQNK